MTALSRAQKDYEGKQPSCGRCLPPPGQPGDLPVCGASQKAPGNTSPSQKAPAWSLRSSNTDVLAKSEASTAWEPVFKASPQLLQPAMLLSAGSWSADSLARARLESGDSEAGPETQAAGAAGV